MQFQLDPKKDTLLETLTDESQSAVNWFRNNNMIVNPDKFHLMLLQKSAKKVIRNSKSVTTKLNLRIR